MNKKQSIYTIIMIILITAIVSLLLSTVFVYNYVTKNSGTKYVFVGTEKNMNLQKSVSAIRDIIDEYYLGDVPSDNDMIEGAVKGYVAALDDEYTEYMTSSEWKEYQTEALGNYTGLGVVLTGDDMGQKITNIVKNSPAEKNGLKIGDIILKVDDIVCNKDNGAEVTEYIKNGETGTKFKIEVQRGEENFTKEITRELVRVIQISNKMLENNIGYIKLSTFDQGCAEDFRNNCDELIANGAKAIIIDVRNNTGGVLDGALDIAEMFLDKDATMLISHNKSDKEKIYKSTTKKEIDLPVVVLTNEYSASASEVLVAALKDNNAATILGTKTYGKGVLQDVLSLSNGAALKITSYEFFRPNGEKIHKVGIEPDVVLEIPSEYTNIAYVPEGKDNQLKKAIDLLK